MDRIKHWYNKKLAELYIGKNAEISFNTWRQILFRLPFYSPSLYTYYRWIATTKRLIKAIELMKNDKTYKKGEKILNDLKGDINQVNERIKQKGGVIRLPFYSPMLHGLKIKQDIEKIKQYIGKKAR